MKIEDLNIIITGATGGIGHWLATLLSHHGARVIAIGRNQEKLQTLIEHLTPPPQGQHTYFCCDITDKHQRQMLIEKLQQYKPSPNYLINLAGYGGLTLFEQEPVKHIEQTLLVNVTATVLLTQQLLPLLKQQAAAGIVNVGSIFGNIGHPGYVSYCTSKFAIRGFSESLQRELSDSAIDVKYFAPRATKTDFNSQQARALNKALKNSEDEPAVVAEQLLAFIQNHNPRRLLGWPERFFVWLNNAAPSLVSRALQQQLPTIKKFAVSNTGETL